MEKIHNVCCPNCGSQHAQRRYFTRVDARKCPGKLVNQVECPACDYLMVTCTEDGQVLEAYASGILAPDFVSRPKSVSLALQS